MAGNEWVVKVTADVKGVLDASRQIGQAGKQAGQNFQDGFNGTDKTLSGLSTQLRETTGGVKSFGESQQNIVKNQGDVNSVLGKGNGILGSLTDGVKSFALQTGSVLTVGAALQFAGKQIMDLDTASAAVRTLGVDSKALSKELLKLSTELDGNVSRVELMQASYDVASSGFTKTSEIVDILRASALGATGGFSDLATVADAVTSVINSYGLEASDATSIVDSFIQTQNDGKITVAQFGKQIGNIAAVAAAANIPLSELSAAIADATAKGVPVEQTFTGLRQAISSIIKPSKQATDEAERLGIEYNLTGLKARGFAGFLADVVTKSKGSADSIAILTGSVEAQAPIQQIANDKLKNYNEFLDNQITKTGQAKAAAEIASATIAGGIEKITNASSNLVTVLGASGGGSVGEFLSRLATGISLVQALTGKAVEAAGAIKSVFTFTPPAKAVYELKEGFDSLIISGAKWITSQLTGTTQLTVAQEKQIKAIAQGNQDLLDLAKAYNKEQLERLDYDQKIADAQGKLAKAQSDSQLQIGQASINLGQALVGLEESRYSIIQNRNNYELQQARERGASEAEIEGIKRQGEVIEAAALSSKYQALVEQQGLERQLLDLKQQQALVEANTEARKANTEYRKAEIEYDAARLANLNENSNLTQDALDKARETLEIKGIERQEANENLDILKQIQPIQDKIADASEEEQINRLLSTAAAKGLQLSADNIFLKTKGAAGEFKTLGNSMKVPLGQQDAFTQLARDMGFAVRDTGKGYVEIGKDLTTTNKTAANDIKAYMSIVAKSTQAAKTQTGGLANNMGTAANAAERFYSALASASGLPPARFTGGPVEAGQTYRINDGPSGMSLGQEAFLSASGALSLINRPANSLWTAPSPGTVIPAAITSRLKESGALGGGAGVLRGGSDPAVAHLALAVGNLSQEVAELRRKAWNVSVGVRGDGSGLRLAQTMARMR
jgi:TP901 family phage tail tape measure protein